MEASSSSTNDNHSNSESHTYLLTPGKAWSISLTLRSTMHEEILKTCFAHHDEVKENLLYRFVLLSFFFWLKELKTIYIYCVYFLFLDVELWTLVCLIE